MALPQRAFLLGWDLKHTHIQPQGASHQGRPRGARPDGEAAKENQGNSDRRCDRRRGVWPGVVSKEQRYRRVWGENGKTAEQQSQVREAEWNQGLRMQDGRTGAEGEAGPIQACGHLTDAGSCLCVLGPGMHPDLRKEARALQSHRVHGEDPRKAFQQVAGQHDGRGS